MRPAGGSPEGGRTYEQRPCELRVVDQRPVWPQRACAGDVAATSVTAPHPGALRGLHSPCVPVAAQGVACVAVLTPPRSRSEGSLEHRLV